MRLRFAPFLAPLVAAGLFGCASEPPPPPPAPPVVIPRPKPVLQTPTHAPICGKPAEKAAQSLTALRMVLSVTELQCDARDQFNAFTKKFGKDIGAQNKVLNTYFSRAYGRQGQTQQDIYETSQINQAQQEGNYYGVDFCKTAMPLFDQVMALKNGQELVDFAVAQNISQTLTVDECAPPAPPPAKPAAKPAVKK